MFRMNCESSMTSDEKTEPVFPLVRTTALICVGIGFCLFLIYLNYSSSGEAGRFCAIFGTDCAAVTRSAFGSFGGISTATIGLSYYIFQLSILIGLFRIRAEAPELLVYAAFWISSAGLAFSLLFVYLLQVVLQQSCLACYGVHFINAILFGQGLILFVRDRRVADGQCLTGLFREPKSLAVFVISLLAALNVTFGASFLEARRELAAERGKLQQNLQYYKYLYAMSEYHEFEIEPADIVVGEKGIAIHQIVMFYKERCDHCRAAEEKLSAIVEKNDLAVYLVLKNVKHFTPRQLDTLGVGKTPTIYIDGKKAAGWEVPGFLNEFTRDCGC